MVKKEIKTTGAEVPTGPYSQGLTAGKTIYVAGQGPVNPATQKSADTIQEQTHQVMKNISAVLEAAGGKMDDVVKATVHLETLQDFDEFNKVYKTYFTPPYPVRTTVGSRLLNDFRVEIDVIAEME